MFIRCIGHVVRVTVIVMIVLTLLVGCRETESAATAVLPTDTPVPPTTLSPTNTTGPDAPDPPDLTPLTGAYLGQNPPGALPVRFTPDILLPDGSWWWISPPEFSPDGQEMVFTKYILGNPDTKHLCLSQSNCCDDDCSGPGRRLWGN